MKQAERATTHMIGFLQDEVWSSVAVSNVTRMRRPFLAQDSQ